MRDLFLYISNFKLKMLVISGAELSKLNLIRFLLSYDQYMALLASPKNLGVKLHGHEIRQS